MTAIVGFMNKRGIAMAADSAVTLGNTHKVMNSGNKIFTLSKYAPVGIATYGNESFMETPWELVIKMYRKQLGERSLVR
jgi:ATP-dependent protease HslVU (ClpYQ) peptidase subunit